MLTIYPYGMERPIPPDPFDPPHPGCVRDPCRCPPPIILPKYPPCYTFHHPIVQRIRLGAVKTGIFNPALPRLRSYEMDNMTARLPEEHRQMTTTCCLEDFVDAKETYAIPPMRYRVPTNELSDRRYLRYYITDGDMMKEKAEFRQYIHCGPEPEPPAEPRRPTDMHAGCIRRLPCSKFKRPITKFPRRFLDDIVGLDKFGQKVVPCEKFSQYRDTWAQCKNPVSSAPWRKY